MSIVRSVVVPVGEDRQQWHAARDQEIRAREREAAFEHFVAATERPLLDRLNYSTYRDVLEIAEKAITLGETDAGLTASRVATERERVIAEFAKLYEDLDRRANSEELDGVNAGDCVYLLGDLLAKLRAE